MRIYQVWFWFRRELELDCIGTVDSLLEIGWAPQQESNESKESHVCIQPRSVCHFIYR